MSFARRDGHGGVNPSARRVRIGEQANLVKRALRRVTDPAMIIGLQRLAGNQAVQRLLTDPSGKGGASLQRQAKSDDRAKTKTPKDPDPKYPEYAPADAVREMKRDNETWYLTIDGHTSTAAGPAAVTEESVRHLIWPSRAPSGVTVTLKVAITEPIDRGWFVVTGVSFDTLATMEPSIAKRFSDHGVEDETKESPEIVAARAAFRARHEGHGEWRLNVIDFALRRVTRRNPELRLAYYKYYADNNLRDESKWGDHMDFDEDVNTGATAYGGTIINPKVLTLSAGDRFPTDDPVSLLAGTLIHEFAHTPQGGGDNDVSAIQHEAKAYGIELFFSERMGDDKRAKVIGDMNWSTDSFKVGSGADKIFWHSYFGIKAIYAVIDQGGPAAKEARDMSAEFVSKESGDYSPKLQEFLAKV